MPIYPNIYGGPIALNIAVSISKSFVVSYNKYGNPLSFYDDDTWDFTAYSPSSKPRRLNFTHWCGSRSAPSISERALVAELKKLIYLIVYKRPGIPLSITTVRHYFDLLVLICRYAIKNEISLSGVLSVDEVFLDFSDVNEQNQLGSLAQLVSILQQFSVSDLGFIAVGRSMLKKARERQVNFRGGMPSRQHPPLPTRIYTLFISKLIEELEYNEKLLDRFLKFIEESHSYRELPSNKRPQQFVAKLIEQYDLYDHFSVRELNQTLYGINRSILEIFVSCKLMIHTFSGMRDGEVEFLPYDCLAPVSKKGMKHYMLNGFTTKFANGKKKKAKWVVSIEAYRAVVVVQKLSALIYRLSCDEKCIPSDASLFLSPGMLIERFQDGLRGPRLDLCHFKKLKSRLVGMIAEEDLQELQDIDPFRIWALETDFKVGKEWHLTVHQLRRSLALYASRSGLVTLPSLRRQLQHITEEMARYYASGSFFAKNVLDPYDDHFSLQYLNAQVESLALSFIKNVMNSSEDSFGAVGAWFHKPKDVEVTKEDYRETLVKARKGLIAYTETPVGGCSKSGDCVHRSFGKFTHCLSQCDKSLIKIKPLQALIVAQEMHINRLEPNTMMWRNETAVLGDYKAALDRILKRRAKSGGRR